MLNKFGKTVLFYFLSNFQIGTTFKLSIDDYTFSVCSQRAGLGEVELIKELQKNETFFIDEFEALAIAAFQVKIAGDVRSVTASGSDGYYQKIRDNYPEYKKYGHDAEIMARYFEGKQEDIWKCVKELFKKNKRYLIVPEERSGPGRYVQYPVKARELTNTELLKWANEFRNRGLKPNQIHRTYKIFCDLFFARSQYRSELYKRTVFNFYGIWDGRSYEEIINKKHIAHSDSRNQNQHSNILLEIDDNTLVFYDKDTGTKICDIKQIEQLCYSQFQKKYFKQNENCSLYELKKDKIEENSEFVLLSSEDLQFETQTISFKFPRTIEQITFFAYGLTATKDLCDRLKLNLIDPPPIKFVGGLKKRNGHYFSFALPAIEFSETQDIVYINTIFVKVENNRVYLSSLDKKNFEHGICTIKVPDYIPIKIEIDVLKTENERSPDAIGWLFSEKNIPIPAHLPAEDTKEEKKIQGFWANYNLTENMQQNSVNVCTRRFLVLKNKREKRFLEKILKNEKRRGYYE